MLKVKRMRFAVREIQLPNEEKKTGPEYFYMSFKIQVFEFS